MRCFIRKTILFTIGGSSYVALELLWRGRSHRSMFFAGGTCFLLLGALDRQKMPIWAKALASTGVVTGVELLAGLLCNRDHKVWDYRDLPWNWAGQICLPYSLLWVPVGLGAMIAYRNLDQCLGKSRIPLFVKRRGV